jgi:predicted amidohydrolase YtcJ
MRFAYFSLSFFLLAVCFSFPSAVPDSPPAPADVIVTNARIYTMNPQQQWAEAIAIRGEKILAVGDKAKIESHHGKATKVIDAQGRLVLPGFTDCHIHFLDGSLSLVQLNLDDATALAEVQQRVKSYAAAYPDLAWVQGRGWNYTLFGAAGLPDKKYLDAIVSDRPVYLEGFDGHTWWANSKALQLAGITKATPDPAGGSFVRDPKTGEPTGAVKEDAADEVVRHAIPRPSKPEVVAALRRGMLEANRVGLVRAISADGVHVVGGDFEYLEVYDELRQSGQLTVRLDVSMRIQPPALTAEQLRRIEDAGHRYHDHWLAAGKAKFFVDGVIETHTAAMLAPYADDPSQSGHLLWDPDKYVRAVEELDAHGIQVFSHAIGDRAIRLALDAYENAQKVNRTSDRRHRIEHIEDPAASDLPRFGKLGVIASFQPLHAYPNDDTLKLWAGNVGPERALRGWPWRTVENGGGVLAFGSDWPIVTQNPWPGVQNALTRQTNEGEPAGGWVPKERIPLPDAIRAYTLGAAFAGHREKSEGSLEAGKLADLIVIDRNLFIIEPTEIGKTEVLMTMVGGKVVYESPNWKSPAATEKK